MIAVPIVLTIYFTRKFKQGWRLFWIGAITFIFSQILHIPFNALVTPIFNQFKFISLPLIWKHLILSGFLGLSAGVFEELFRFVMYRWWAKDARSWGSGLLTGTGHGGAEAIILGLLALYGYMQMLVVRGVDVSTLVTPDRVELAKTMNQAYWTAPVYLSLLGALERLFAITVQLACSVLVLQAFTRKRYWWVAIAILFHALVDGITVYVSQIGFTAIEIEGIVGIFALIGLGIIFGLYKSEVPINPVPVSIPPKQFFSAPVVENQENLDKTRYQ
jgi:uncharacterized membrane protein YhfC